MSYKHLFSRAFAAAPARLHMAAHSHHLWPDASYEGHTQAWNDAARLADQKWDVIMGEAVPAAQRHVASELRLPDPDTVAFAPNTHELLTRVLSAHPARCVRVLASDGEFHSFRRQAARWAEAGRIALDLVPTHPRESFAQRFLEAARAGAHDVLFVSHVMFKTGLVLTALGELASLADPAGPWLIIDGYHGFMALPTDLSAIADRAFYLAGGYKYAMAGEGAAFLHAPPGFAARPELTGWYAEFAALEHTAGAVGYAANAARFWGATFDASGLYRFNAVRAMLAREGLDTPTVCAHVAPLLRALAHSIGAGEAGPLAKAELVNPPPPQGHGARFLALRHPDAQAWRAALLARDVIVDARDDILRIGLGLYHDEADLSRFCAVAKEALA